MNDHCGYHFPLHFSPEFHDFHHLKFVSHQIVHFQPTSSQILWLRGNNWYKLTQSMEARFWFRISEGISFVVDCPHIDGLCYCHLNFWIFQTSRQQRNIAHVCTAMCYSLCISRTIACFSFSSGNTGFTPAMAGMAFGTGSMAPTTNLTNPPCTGYMGLSLCVWWMRVTSITHLILF